MSDAPASLSPRNRVRLRKFASIFLAGLLAVLPIVVTAAVVMWLIRAAESILGGLLSVLLPGPLYLPGMGLLLAVLLIFLVGLGIQGAVLSQLMQWIDVALNRIPLVKTVYGAVRDLTSLMSGDSSTRFRQVVTVQLPNMPIRLVGFVTVDALSSTVLAGTADEVAVYLPMSYQIGGYTLLLPRELLTPLDMSFEEAMRFVITAGLSRPDEPPTVPPPTTTTTVPPVDPTKS